MLKHVDEPDGINPELSPYIGHHIIIKASGEQIQKDNKDFLEVAQYIGYLTSIGISIILVAGGGNQITQMWNTLGRGERPKGKDGGNFTTKELLQDAVLPAEQKIRADIQAILPNVVFVDSSNVVCEKIESLGEVGHPVKIEADFPINDSVKVVTFVGTNKEKTEMYNVNADDVTLEVARTLGDTVAKVMFITGSGGILDTSGNVVSFITQSGLQAIIAGKSRTVQVDGGMKKKAMVVEKFVETGTPVVVTTFQDVKEELESTKGKGTLIVQDEQIELNAGISLELLEKVYEEQVTLGNWKKRSPEEIEKLSTFHYLASAHSIPLGGLSLVPREEGGYTIEALWTAETGCGLGKIILRKLLNEQQGPFYAYSKSAGFFLSLGFTPIENKFSETGAQLYKKS